MFIHFEERPSGSPFIEKVWRCHSDRTGIFSSIAACHWEMVVSRYEGRTSLTVRGPETRVSDAQCPADGEWFAMRFRLGTFMPKLPPGALRDRNDLTLPDASSRAFWLDGSALEYPSFENADTFVARLVRDGVIAVDARVTNVLRAHADGTHLRTAQRHFLKATGMTHNTIRQIERARHATLLLREGTSILDVVGEAGYYDQAHLTRSLRHFVGQTPAEVARAERQLSFLYKT